MYTLGELFRMWRRARHFGFPLERSRGWRPPEEIWIRGHKIPLKWIDDLGVKNAFRDIFLHDCYGLEAIHYPVATVLDIGANMGFFSLYARDRFPEATIHAYEPNPALADAIRHHAEVGNFEYFDEAVGVVTEQVDIIEWTEGLVYGTTRAAPDGKIRKVPFAECLERLGGKVDIVKMDCEGGEWEILQDVETWRKVRFVAMECHAFEGHTKDDAKDILRNLGFTLLNPRFPGVDNTLLWAVRDE